jgi:uncharacterized protein
MFALPSAPTRAAASPAPLDADERLHALDILHGLAVFGMILVHFHQKMRLEATGLDDLIGWAVYVLFEQKAWGVFAFLFGVGFAVLLRRLEARHAPVLPIYLRRSVTMIVLGEALLTGSRALLAYWAVWFLAANLFVIGYEEPTLHRRFGPAYERYRATVGR